MTTEKHGRTAAATLTRLSRKRSVGPLLKPHTLVSLLDTTELPEKTEEAQCTGIDIGKTTQDTTDIAGDPLSKSVSSPSIPKPIISVLSGQEHLPLPTLSASKL